MQNIGNKTGLAKVKVAHYDRWFVLFFILSQSLCKKSCS